MVIFHSYVSLPEGTLGFLGKHNLLLKPAISFLAISPGWTGGGWWLPEGKSWDLSPGEGKKLQENHGKPAVAHGCLVTVL